MLSRIKPRHVIGLVLISYQITVDFLKDHTLEWYYETVEQISAWQLPETYEGPMIWVAFMILHRAVIHTAVIYCWTGNKGFTQLYGLIEVFLLFGLIVLYALKNFVGSWELISFEIFGTFLQLLISPLLLVVFLPAYYIFKEIPSVK